MSTQTETNQRRTGIPRTRAWGIGLAFATAVISGLAVFLNGYAVRRFDDATVFTTAKNGVAALILVAVVIVASARSRPEPQSRPETRYLPRSRGQWWRLALIGLVGGSIPFVLFFEGLARASSIQAGFIHKTLVVWVALLAVPLLKERLGPLHVGAIILLIWGQVVLAGDLSVFSIGQGELMILAATLLWAIEFVVAKRLLRSLPSVTVGAGRLGIGIVLLVGLVLVTGRAGGFAAYGLEQWFWVALTGVVLSGFVTTWYAALARAQAVDVTAVLVFGAVITAALNGAFEGTPIGGNAFGLGLITLGCVLVAVAAVGRPGPGLAR